ncbi:hypothetical protein NSK_003728 [Nannochloropsis salina CCMP1776]|uniref:LisH domain-containing protein n=1 Tax=Nannochloropsis salina CCMP1776 TaxID=1027361 RepID=A0A4D9D780_9STRA|nr:hypothetical protein NSK_003728 [Nannochloropsis salina CCMP1776]|eukprot:TFJ85305.1 hypothetical protein NSK_003728 [Nannochloropsis salina CCMP1776]
MSFNTDEVNILVHRYLVESGYSHSAFTFFNEGGLDKTNLRAADVPPGALIAYLQKGLEYVSIEEHINEDGSLKQCEEPFTLITPHICSNLKKTEGRLRKDGRSSASSSAQDLLLVPPPPFPESHVALMKEHTKEVFVLAWNPRYDMLATGSGDCTGLLWRLPGQTVIMSDENGRPIYEEPVVLRHAMKGTEKSKDVTCVEWSRDGEHLLTGCYDGIARVWGRDGKLEHSLANHEGAIFALKWNPSASYVASGSYDQSAVVWDTATAQPLKKWARIHEAPILDLAWRNETSLATGSADKTIKLLDLKQEGSEPLQTFRGHTDEVNTVAWDPTGALLASCSDDTTAKIWQADSPTCVQDLKEHKKEIYTIRWAPTGPGSDNPDKKKLFASASFDNTVKLWDVEVGKSVATLTRHPKAVYAMAFDKTGDYIASGALGGSLYVWSVKDGSIVRSFHGGGDIFEIAWDRRGERLAACYSSGKVAVLDFRK